MGSSATCASVSTRRDVFLRVLFHHPSMTPLLFQMLTGSDCKISPPLPTEEEKKQVGKIVDRVISLHRECMRAAMTEILDEGKARNREEWLEEFYQRKVRTRMVRAHCQNCRWEYKVPEELFGEGKSKLRAALSRCHYEDQPSSAMDVTCNEPDIMIEHM